MAQYLEGEVVVSPLMEEQDLQVFDRVIIGASVRYGPRLLILANTALNASKGSTPHAITLNKQIVNTNRYAEKKAQILPITRSSRTFYPFN